MRLLLAIFLLCLEGLSQTVLGLRSDQGYGRQTPLSERLYSRIRGKDVYMLTCDEKAVITPVLIEGEIYLKMVPLTSTEQTNTITLRQESSSRLARLSYQGKDMVGTFKSWLYFRECRASCKLEFSGPPMSSCTQIQRQNQGYPKKCFSLVRWADDNKKWLKEVSTDRFGCMSFKFVTRNQYQQLLTKARVRQGQFGRPDSNYNRMDVERMDRFRQFAKPGQFGPVSDYNPLEATERDSFRQYTKADMYMVTCDEKYAIVPTYSDKNSFALAVPLSEAEESTMVTFMKAPSQSTMTRVTHAGKDMTGIKKGWVYFTKCSDSCHLSFESRFSPSTKCSRLMSGINLEYCFTLKRWTDNRYWLKQVSAAQRKCVTFKFVNANEYRRIIRRQSNRRGRNKYGSYGYNRQIDSRPRMYSRGQVSRQTYGSQLSNSFSPWNAYYLPYYKIKKAEMYMVTCDKKYVMVPKYIARKVYILAKPLSAVDRRSTDLPALTLVNGISSTKRAKVSYFGMDMTGIYKDWVYFEPCLEYCELGFRSRIPISPTCSQMRKRNKYQTCYSLVKWTDNQYWLREVSSVKSICKEFSFVTANEYQQLLSKPSTGGQLVVE